MSSVGEATGGSSQGKTRAHVLGVLGVLKSMPGGAVAVLGVKHPRLDGGNHNFGSNIHCGGTIPGDAENLIAYYQNFPKKKIVPGRHCIHHYQNHNYLRMIIRRGQLMGTQEQNHPLL